VREVGELGADGVDDVDLVERKGVAREGGDDEGGAEGGWEGEDVQEACGRGIKSRGERK
jgi:hypothetical protein